jgi:hypothetical protein
MLRHATQLVALRERTGVVITLAIEPEPACFIETTADAIAFFTRHLFDESGVARASRESGIAMTVDDVRRHVGLCFDACHMAVEFEDPGEAIAQLHAAGIRIGKVQISSALQLDQCDAAGLTAALAPFAEDTYLHQVVERGSAGLVRYRDLPEALTGASRQSPLRRRDWRVHFHVPIFLERMNALETTQAYLRTVLDLLKADDVCSVLEVETYTWDVLPEEYRTVDVCTAIARELTWARDALEA